MTRDLAVLMFVALAGCGRSGFDPIGARDAEGDVAMRDGTLAVHWTKRDDSAPGALMSPRLTYHPIRKTVLLYGGDNGTGGPPPMGATAAMWELSAAGWQQLCNPCAPGKRFTPGFAYDPASDRVVLFGGEDPSGRKNDTWEWDGTNWSQISGASPPGTRSHAQLIYDPIYRHLLLLGGTDGVARYTDAYEYILGQWVPLNLTNVPILDGLTINLVHDGTRLLAASTTNMFDDVLVQATGLDFTSLCTACSGTARRDAAMVHYPALGTIMVGGYTGSSLELNGTWIVDGASWRLLDNDLPSRDTVGLAYDADRGVVVAYGGNGNSCVGTNENCNETWELGP